MEYYSATKRNAFESVLMRWMNLEPITQSEVRKRKTIFYVNAHIWSLERQYFQGSKGDTHVKNRLLETVGEGEGGMI